MENNKEITIGKDIEEIKESFFHTLVPVAFSTYLSLMQDKDNPKERLLAADRVMGIVGVIKENRGNGGNNNANTPNNQPVFNFNLNEMKGALNKVAAAIVEDDIDINKEVKEIEFQKHKTGGSEVEKKPKKVKKGNKSKISKEGNNSTDPKEFNFD